VARSGRQQVQRGLQGIPRRDLTDPVRMLDRCVDFRVGKTGLSRFRDVILDAGYAAASHCSAKCHQFTFTGGQITHDILL
jgi:hypothetical protein